MMLISGIVGLVVMNTSRFLQTEMDIIGGGFYYWGGGIEYWLGFHIYHK